MRPNNSFQIIGGFVADPEQRATANEPMVVFKIAEQCYGAQKAQYHDCAAFGVKLCGQIMQHLCKGRKVLIQGEIRNRVAEGKKYTFLKVENWLAMDPPPPRGRVHNGVPAQPPEGLDDLEHSPDFESSEAPPWEE